jgi:hypothetical protein
MVTLKVSAAVACKVHQQQWSNIWYLVQQ